MMCANVGTMSGPTARSFAKNLWSRNVLQSQGVRRMFKDIFSETTFASSSPLTHWSGGTAASSRVLKRPSTFRVRFQRRHSCAPSFWRLPQAEQPDGHGDQLLQRSLCRNCVDRTSWPWASRQPCACASHSPSLVPGRGRLSPPSLRPAPGDAKVQGHSRAGGDPQCRSRYAPR